MTIRNALCGLVLTAAFVVTAEAAPVWNGAGWYQVADTNIGLFVEKGPFASKEVCEASLPKDDDSTYYYCEYLNERPSWDESW